MKNNNYLVTNANRMLIYFLIFGSVLFILIAPISFYACLFVDLQKFQATLQVYLYNFIKVFDDDAEVVDGKLELHGTVEKAFSFKDLKEINNYAFLVKAFSLKKCFITFNTGNKIGSTTAVFIASLFSVMANTVMPIIKSYSRKEVNFDTKYTFDTNLSAVIEAKLTTNFLAIITNTIIKIGGKLWNRTHKTKTK